MTGKKEENCIDTLLADLKTTIRLGEFKIVYTLRGISCEIPKLLYTRSDYTNESIQLVRTSLLVVLFHPQKPSTFYFYRTIFRGIIAIFLMKVSMNP